jgi:hypothetical protein
MPISKTPGTNRRSFLREIALGGTAGAAAVALPFAEGPVWRFVGAASWDEVFARPRSAYFGLQADGAARDSMSYYDLRSAEPDRLTFDISNQQILCSISRNGLLERSCIETAVAPIDMKTLEDPRWLRGHYVDKRLARGGAWPLRLEIGGDAVDLDKTAGIRAELLGALFPVFSGQHGNVRFQMLAFAPIDEARESTSPRAIVVVVALRNMGSSAAMGALYARLPPNQEPSQAMMMFGGASRGDFRLEPGEGSHLALALLLDESRENLAETAARLAASSALDWLNQTWEYHAGRLGRLRIPEEPFYAESFVRLEELCRQCSMRTRDGAYGGGFDGNDISQRPGVWTKDVFYSVLPASMLQPGLCADAILYFLDWGKPPRAYGRGLARFPNPAPVTHSLGNALSPLILAGAYYQMTGDRDFFKRHPEILTKGRQLLRAVADSRQGEEFLFPSLYVSDGDSRGDFHTGSNLLAWYSFRQMARIAADAYGDAGAAREWEQVAARVKQDMWRRCAGTGPLGAQFFEGGTRDFSFILGHDGEESDVSLMPFYGFCESDEPALVNFSHLALTPQNPWYARSVDGIWWVDDRRIMDATFPAWTTSLAGAASEKQLHRNLQRIRRLTDVDGSIWWWPYKYLSADATAVHRNNAKCGWSAGVLLCMFVHNVLGIGVDVPARTTSFRPFCPWERFAWHDCHLGSAKFDFEYRRTKNSIGAGIVNRNAAVFQATVEVTLSTGQKAASCLVNGRPTKSFTMAKRYNRPSVQIRREVAPAAELRLEVET